MCFKNIHTYVGLTPSCLLILISWLELSDLVYVTKVLQAWLFIHASFLKNLMSLTIVGSKVRHLYYHRYSNKNIITLKNYISIDSVDFIDMLLRNTVYINISFYEII